MKKVLIPFVMVAVLVAIPYVGVTAGGQAYLFGVIVPYTAAAIFLLGFLYRMIDWLKRPVPFRITTTAGQEKTLDWIPYNRIDSPATPMQAWVRILLEVFFFRSLFRNTKAELREGPSFTFASSKWLWMGGLAFHWSLLVIVLRHTRFFFAELPGFVQPIEVADRFMELTLPAFYLTDALVLAAITFLFVRRLRDVKLSVISLPTDYFPLLLIGSIAVAGVLMRYVDKVDIMTVKALTMNLAQFSFDPVPGDIGPIFYVHLFLVSVLMAYIPFSKLMHMGGIFLSPTRNLCNNSREKRHVNPWNKPIKFRTYAEYEDEFREKMKKAKLPLEKE
ncbi:MAG: sulfate reduction electron transfer complex DsrMKJOP subunit DsrM [Chlorobiaceae bacterium]|nr:sulfate reduction electron transfer complex DsrMKJOP subunit DsrM [Chlorobiales bacterium]NTU90971.1 sulfate reduction electron transfer complex DsrMKJOP subunit DsrM [Chlorobiaceae bacterium]NTV26599.1 sulfate reduction electron transfer complex DsrMKJOP subunit DsrM [Chlorobiaceae bacterium]